MNLRKTWLKQIESTLLFFHSFISCWILLCFVTSMELFSCILCVKWDWNRVSRPQKGVRRRLLHGLLHFCRLFRSRSKVFGHKTSCRECHRCKEMFLIFTLLFFFQGPFKTINTLVNLCKNTKKRSKKEFLNTYLLQHNDAIQPLFDKNLFAEAFATSSAFLTLNFDYSFFINLETEYRKRSNWTEVLIAKRNRTLVFKNQNQLSAVGDSKFSTEEVYRIMAFEKRLLHGDDGEYKLTR